jgi:hypothetical protein
MATSGKTNNESPKATITPARVKAESLDIRSSDETLDLAKDLAKFIKENRLSTQVQGKEFVNVEGWQYAGSRLGIVPIVEHVINVSSDHELKYQAKVTLFDMRSQHTVGAGFAVCSNKESGKKFYQEFAIASMAQTRAIGKAYRNILAWIIRAAGYEPTPAEEMEYAGNVPAPTAAPVPAETVPMSVSAGGLEPDTPVVVKYATASQKEEIIRLLNHPLITRQEKSKMLLNIQRLDEERAALAITKLNSAIENRAGTSGTEPVGNEPAGETPAANNSDAPAPSTTSDQSSEDPLAEKRAHFDTLLSGLDIEAFWKTLTGGEQKQLRDAKDAAKTRVAEAVALAARTMTRQQPVVGMKDAGTDASLVVEFVEQPAVAGVEFVAATEEQKQSITRLLDYPAITRKEKTTLLLKINKLDKERARQAIIKLREAIEYRTGTNGEQARGLRELLHKQLNEYGAVLGEEIVAEYSLLVENADATTEQLRLALDEVRQVLSVNQDNEEESETAQAA